MMQQPNRHALMQMFEADAPGALPGAGPMRPPAMPPPAGVPTMDTFDPMQRSSNTGVGGPTAPIDTGPAPAGPTDYRSVVSGILGKHGYGAQGLASAEQDLAAQGITMQKNSAGLHRGRIKLPNGQIVDVIDPGDAGYNADADPSSWFKGQNWGWKEQGSEGDTSDGWSFNKGGGAPMPMGGAPMGGNLLDAQLQGDPMAAIQQALAKYAGGPNLQALLGKFGG